MMTDESQLSLSARLEALLFAAAEPLTVSTLAHMLGVDREQVEHSIDELEQKLSGRGVMLSRNANEIALVTHPEAFDDVRKITQHDLTKDLGQAGLETLAVILYQGPISKRALDYIRGVNCTSVLRNLLMRGLIQKEAESSQRSAVYRATFDTLSHLGLSKIEELPEYETVQNELAIHENASDPTDDS